MDVCISEMGCHCFLFPVRFQAITWTNADPLWISNFHYCVYNVVTLSGDLFSITWHADISAAVDQYGGDSSHAQSGKLTRARSPMRVEILPGDFTFIIARLSRRVPPKFDSHLRHDMRYSGSDIEQVQTM